MLARRPPVGLLPAMLHIRNESLISAPLSHPGSFAKRPLPAARVSMTSLHVSVKSSCNLSAVRCTDFKGTSLEPSRFAPVRDGLAYLPCPLASYDSTFHLLAGGQISGRPSRPVRLPAGYSPCGICRNFSVTSNLRAKEPRDVFGKES